MLTHRVVKGRLLARSIDRVRVHVRGVRMIDVWRVVVSGHGCCGSYSRIVVIVMIVLILVVGVMVTCVRVSVAVGRRPIVVIVIVVICVRAKLAQGRRSGRRGLGWQKVGRGSWINAAVAGRPRVIRLIGT